jgi:hypothetical protein
LTRDALSCIRNKEEAEDLIQKHFAGDDEDGTVANNARCVRAQKIGRQLQYTGAGNAGDRFSVF